ncbi:MAG: tripartite tricarboxylate transporter substrate binding protein [Burkholderiales bacterium]|nr:tripartite tricarboxylate transporter substrate binding protein [Burkholderiales bacterium]MDE1925564.1 tripartite tricarboxylate transporter substrate binding protein [Burkholderiales bacterium]MDE2503275.1 tripartite tricarboxylate transporter substrate binding protein [Burkholderiales bacterium]
MNSTRRTILAAVGLAPLVAIGRQQDGFPTRPVTVVVGFPAGQTTDIVARTIVQDMSTSLGQSFVVDNRPGAGSTFAVGLVTRAKPDGYTLLWGGSGNLAIAPYLYKFATYDPLKDLEALTMGGYAPMLLTVRADSKYHTLAELLQAAKQTTLNYGSGGSGVTNHLGMELLRGMTGAKLFHVPYKGSVPAMNDLLGGRLDLMFDSIPSSVAQIKAGRLRALAVSSSKRLRNFPEIPAVAELVPGYECVAWTALCAPGGTPARVQELLASAALESMSKPSVHDSLEQLGNYVDPTMNIEKTRQWIASQGAKFKKIIQDNKITAD